MVTIDLIKKYRAGIQDLYLIESAKYTSRVHDEPFYRAYRRRFAPAVWLKAHCRKITDALHDNLGNRNWTVAQNLIVKLMGLAIIVEDPKVVLLSRTKKSKQPNCTWKFFQDGP